MPAELVNCPECRRTLRVPGDLIGKLVKCPTCGHTFTGNPGEAVAPPPAPPPPPPPPPPRTSRVDPDKEDFDEERDRRRRKRDREDDEDDYDDRRRRRRRSRSRSDDDDDDYEDRRPRRDRRRDLAAHRGGTVLTLGILALVLPFLIPLAGLICGIIAWSMGNADLAEMRLGRMDREGESQTSCGRILGMISVILHIVGILLLAVLFMALCAGTGSTGHNVN